MILLCSSGFSVSLTLSGSLFHVSTILIAKDSLVVVDLPKSSIFVRTVSEADPDAEPAFCSDPGIVIELKEDFLHFS
jgi:hypothetical protein